MGRLVRLAQGVWEKSGNGEWTFLAVDSGPTFSVLFDENGTYEMLVQTVKKRFYVGAATMMALTYQYPAWMLHPVGNKTPPVDFNEDGDVELFMAVHVDYPEMEICVTIGSYHVERYLFQRRSGYDVGGNSGAVGPATMELDSQMVDGRGVAITRNDHPAMYQGTTCGGLDDAMAFWNGLVRDGVVVASERVLREVCTNDELMVMDMCHKSLVAGPPANVVVLSDCEGSSTGSSSDVRETVGDVAISASIGGRFQAWG